MDLKPKREVSFGEKCGPLIVGLLYPMETLAQGGGGVLGPPDPPPPPATGLVCYSIRFVSKWPYVSRP